MGYPSASLTSRSAPPLRPRGLLTLSYRLKVLGVKKPE
jgi:hypothetical protein